MSKLSSRHLLQQMADQLMVHSPDSAASTAWRQLLGGTRSFPCLTGWAVCRYQVCLFCFDRVKRECSSLCPGCRTEYGTDNFKRSAAAPKPATPRKPQQAPAATPATRTAGAAGPASAQASPQGQQQPGTRSEQPSPASSPPPSSRARLAAPPPSRTDGELDLRPARLRNAQPSPRPAQRPSTSDAPLPLAPLPSFQDYTHPSKLPSDDLHSAQSPALAPLPEVDPQALPEHRAQAPLSLKPWLQRPAAPSSSHPDASGGPESVLQQSLRSMGLNQAHAGSGPRSSAPDLLEQLRRGIAAGTLDAAARSDTISKLTQALAQPKPPPPPPAAAVRQSPVPDAQALNPWAAQDGAPSPPKSGDLSTWSQPASDIAPSIWTDTANGGQPSATAPLFSFPALSSSSAHDTPRIKGSTAPPPGFSRPLGSAPPGYSASGLGPSASADSFLPAELLGRKQSRLAMWQGLQDVDSMSMSMDGHPTHYPLLRDLGHKLAM